MAAAASPGHKGETGAVATCSATGTDADEKRGDDDDLLRMMGVRPKCSNMQEVVEHYTDEPYPPRNPEDERRRIVMDPNNTPIAIRYSGQSQ